MRQDIVFSYVMGGVPRLRDVLGMLMEAYGFEQSDTLLGLLVSLLVYLWCRYDAAERGRRIGRGLSFTIAMLLMIGFPWYLIKVRRYAMGQAISVTFFWMLICVGVSFAGIFFFSWIFDQFYY